MQKQRETFMIFLPASKLSTVGKTIPCFSFVPKGAGGLMLCHAVKKHKLSVYSKAQEDIPSCIPSCLYCNW